MERIKIVNHSLRSKGVALAVAAPAVLMALSAISALAQRPTQPEALKGP